MISILKQSFHENKNHKHFTEYFLFHILHFCHFSQRFLPFRLTLYWKIFSVYDAEYCRILCTDESSKGDF